jgi:hypothetical protein
MGPLPRRGAGKTRVDSRVTSVAAGNRGTPSIYLRPSWVGWTKERGGPIFLPRGTRCGADCPRTTGHVRRKQWRRLRQGVTPPRTEPICDRRPERAPDPSLRRWAGTRLAMSTHAAERVTRGHSRGPSEIQRGDPVEPGGTAAAGFSHRYRPPDKGTDGHQRDYRPVGRDDSYRPFGRIARSLMAAPFFPRVGAQAADPGTPIASTAISTTAPLNARCRSSFPELPRRT